MARRSNNDITGVNIDYPDLRVFSANPNYLQVTGLPQVQNPIEICFNGSYVKRYADYTGSVKFQLQGLFASFFATSEFGNVLPKGTGVYYNASSKAFKEGELIYITTDTQTGTITTVGTAVTSSVAAFSSASVNRYIVYKGIPKLITAYTDTTHVTIESAFDTDLTVETVWNVYVGLVFDLIYGALQIGETEPSNVYIYQFGTLPLTVTQTMGTNASPNGESLTCEAYAKEIDIQSVIEDYPSMSIFEFKIGSEVQKTHNIVKSTCETGVYLRWLSACQGYKYFLFNYGDTTEELKDGVKFNYFIDDFTASSEGLIKGDTQLKSVDGNTIQLCGISTSDVNIQRHLMDLPRATKVWKYENSTWIEVLKEMKPIIIDRFESSKQIDVKVISPKLYNPEI